MCICLGTRPCVGGCMVVLVFFSQPAPIKKHPHLDHPHRHTTNQPCANFFHIRRREFVGRAIGDNVDTLDVAAARTSRRIGSTIITGIFCRRALHKKRGVGWWWWWWWWGFVNEQQAEAGCSKRALPMR